VLGGAVPVGAEAQAWRVAVVIGLCACAPLVWAALGRAARGSWPLVALCCVAALTVAGSVGGFAGSLGPAGTAGPQAAAHKHRARPISNDLLHGRRAIWSASLRAIRERPLQGHGAGGFLTATAHLQDAAITSYAHDLPLEAGVELGLAGGLLVLALYLIVARALWRGRAVAGAWVVAVPIPSPAPQAVWASTERRK
jgi:O-antigen ligase